MTRDDTCDFALGAREYSTAMRSDPSHHHQTCAAAHVKAQPIQCAVLTISDTRTATTDTGGLLIEKLLDQAGHHVAVRTIVPDDPHRIEHQLLAWLSDPAIHVILTTGGTGVSRRDTTIEVVQRLLTVRLDGFGELFRMLSFQQVKAAAMLSRAVGGLVVRDPDAGGGTFIFAMPGSPNAVELAMTQLIVPQLPHLVWERQR